MSDLKRYLLMMAPAIWYAVHNLILETETGLKMISTIIKKERDKEGEREEMHT